MNLLRHTKTFLRRAASSLGFDVSRTNSFGKNPFVDLGKLATVVPRLGFDVGANEGQTACELRRTFPGAKIYCFEPHGPAFRTLQQKLGGDPNICLEQVAFGDRKGEATLYENAESVTNSLLPNAPEAHASQPAAYAIPTGQSTVAVTTLDDYCCERAISHLDFLKIDSQGYDLRILQGARKHLAEHRISFIVVEMLFAPLYAGQAHFHEIYGFLTGFGYRLVGLYAIHRSPAGAILWCDALFRCEPA
ncbi:MAG TPA: FkbM family methyltransferase [Chthoniobacterales bacterium]|nr:FkbM family methyltransferase [Chthoniobacterales bacterium]